MITYSKFTPCKPRTKEQAMLAGKGVAFLKDEEGNCWYDVADELTTKKMNVVAIDDNGVVCGFSAEPRQLYPNGFKVVAVKSLPTYLAGDGMWTFNGKEFEHSRDGAIEEANNRKTTALTNLSTLLQLYNDILAVEELNPTALEAKKKLETYRDQLLAVDVSKAPGIDWPVQPII